MSEPQNGAAALAIQSAPLRGSEEERGEAGDRHPYLDYNHPSPNPTLSPNPNHSHHHNHNHSHTRNFTEASSDCTVTPVGLVTKAEDSGCSSSSSVNKQSVTTATAATTATNSTSTRLLGTTTTASTCELGFTLPAVSSAAPRPGGLPGKARVRFNATNTNEVFTDSAAAEEEERKGGEGGEEATVIGLGGGGGGGGKGGRRKRRKLIGLGEEGAPNLGLGGERSLPRLGLKGRASKRQGFQPRSRAVPLSRQKVSGDGSDEMDAMYRCVPARPLSYTFSDVLSSMTGTPGSQLRNTRSKTAPVSTNAPEEYAERFKSRPTTRPAVIDFNGMGVKMFNTSCGGGFRHLNNPGFPPVKVKNNLPPTSGVGLKSSKSPTLPQPLTERGTTSTSNLHLAPLTKGAEPDTALSLQTRSYRPSPNLHTHHTFSSPGLPNKPPSRTPEMSRFHGVRSAASTRTNKSRGKSSSSSRRVNGGGGPNHHHHHLTPSSNQEHCLTTSLDDSDQNGGGGHWPELTSSKLNTVDAITFSMSPRGIGEQFGGNGRLPKVLAHSDDYDDLSSLPRPKRILPHRNLPWVYRFKVKKEMNALSKIMASKPNSASSSVATTAGP